MDWWVYCLGYLISETSLVAVVNLRVFSQAAFVLRIAHPGEVSQPPASGLPPPPTIPLIMLRHVPRHPC